MFLALIVAIFSWIDLGALSLTRRGHLSCFLANQLIFGAEVEAIRRRLIKLDLSFLIVILSFVLNSVDVVVSISAVSCEYFSSLRSSSLRGFLDISNSD